MFGTNASSPSQRRGYRSDGPSSSRTLLSTGWCAVMRVSLRHRGLYFRHGNHRQKTNEYQEERSENSERADVGPDIHPRRMVNSPGRWQEIAGQTAGNNDEALKPHSRVHAHGDEKDDQRVVAAPAEPKQLR